MNPFRKARWRFFIFLFAMSFLSYAMRQNLHVAAEHIMPEFSLSELQMGWIYSAFVWGYTIFQLPGGIFGERVGPRVALASIGVLWLLTSVLTGLLPGTLLQTSGAVLVGLIVIRFLVGVVHAPIFPIMAHSIESWFPVGSWGLPNALSSTGLSLGAAATQPVVAWIMVTWGWRVAFYAFVPVGMLIFLLWWWYARDRPQLHPAISAAELAEIEAGREALSHSEDPDAWKKLLRNRDTLLLTASYFSMNFVFYLFFTWFYHYLVHELGFGILESGFLAALPWLTGAATAALGGWTCDYLCHRIGPRWGCRLPAIAGMVCTALFLYLGLFASSPYTAVVLLSLCYAATQFTEASYWEAQMFVAGVHAGPATGIMNTGANAAGIVVAPLMPFLAVHIGWVAALSTGVAMAVIGAGLWLLIRADRPFDAGAATAS